MKKLDEYEVIANLEREASINQEKLWRWFPHFGVSLQRLNSNSQQKHPL